MTMLYMLLPTEEVFSLVCLPHGTLANEDFSNKKGVSISPNPSNGVFNININQYSGKVNIQVVDLNGRDSFYC
jgi:hypothetical protein